MKDTIITSLIIILVLIGGTHCFAENPIKTQNTVILIDGSSHSNRSWHGKSKIKVLRESISETLVEVNKTPSWGYMVGVRVFGDKSTREIKDCNDTRVAAELDWFEPALINIIIEGIKPKGRSCFTNALAETNREFSKSKPGGDNYLVCIISDEDECAKQEDITIRYITNAANLKGTYVIGLNVKDSYQKMFDEIFKTYPGEFINVKTHKDLTPVLTKVLNEYCRGIKPKVEEDKTSEKTTKKPDAKTAQKEQKSSL